MHYYCNLYLNVMSSCIPFDLSTVGRPIRVEKNEKPTVEELDALHQLYTEELSQLFEEHKGKYGVPEDQHLSFV